jgi:hypothetical protein
MVMLHSVEDFKKFAKDELFGGYETVEELSFEVFSKITNQVMLVNNNRFLIKLGSGTILSISNDGRSVHRGTRFSADWVQDGKYRNEYLDFWF